MLFRSSATPLREQIALSYPPHLRRATAAGIGLLLTFLGLQNGGFVAANPATMVGPGSLDHRALFTLAGLLISVWLSRRDNPFAYLAGIAFVTAGAWVGGHVTPPAAWFSAPDFSSVLFKLDVWGALRLSLLPALITVMLTDLFDSLSTFIGVANAANLVDANGEPTRLRQGLIVDAVATFGAGLFGTSSGTAYVESIAGIRMGARSGTALSARCARRRDDGRTLTRSDLRQSSSSRRRTQWPSWRSSRRVSCTSWMGQTYDRFQK